MFEHPAAAAAIWAVASLTPMAVSRLDLGVDPAMGRQASTVSPLMVAWPVDWEYRLVSSAVVRLLRCPSPWSKYKTPSPSRAKGTKVRVVPEVFGPRAARAKSIWPVTLTVALVHDPELFSHFTLLMESNRAVIPAVVELGRSNDGPPVLVVMHPGEVVVPPKGWASNEAMV